MRTAICPTQLHFRRLASHFLSLTSGDRLLRFGSVLTDIDLRSRRTRLPVTRCRSAVSPGASRWPTNRCVPARKPDPGDHNAID